MIRGALDVSRAQRSLARWSLQAGIEPSAAVGFIVRQEEPNRGRQGSEEKPGRGRRLGRGVFAAYLRTGAALAIFRVSLLWWVEYRAVTHRMTEPVYNLLWGCALRDSWASTLLLARFTSRV
jgi:hypothetical protein